MFYFRRGEGQHFENGAGYTGANPTFVSYSAGAVKIYNATNSLVRFENKNIFFYFRNALVY
jgi:hypothetical protein